MGDRGNIVIEKDGEMFPSEVYLYTHWSGSEIKETLQAALIKGRDRWSDGSYLARVIFQQLIGSDAGVTGFGLSTTIGDNEHDLLCVNMEKKTVRLLAAHWSDREKELSERREINRWTFEEFVALKLEPVND